MSATEVVSDEKLIITLSRIPNNKWHSMATSVFTFSPHLAVSDGNEIILKTKLKKGTRRENWGQEFGTYLRKFYL